MRNDLFLNHLGKNIQTILTKGITVRQLGELCNLDYANISRMENGKQDVLILTLKNVANVLKMDVKDFI
jgi:transcriptional regulator with XRE-family HTH domain